MTSKHFCENCDYNCEDLSNWNKHLLTNKHLGILHLFSFETPILQSKKNEKRRKINSCAFHLCGLNNDCLTFSCIIQYR